jgi:tight adherence protein C
MDNIPLLTIAFLIVAGVTFLAGWLLLRWWPAVPTGRFSGAPAGSGDASILRWGEEPRAGWRGMLTRVGRAAEPRAEKERRKYRRRLAYAGYHDPNALLFFVGAKVVLAVLLGSLYFLRGAANQVLTPNLVSVSLILGLVGLFLPDFWLYNRVKARQRSIVLALPDVLDLLQVCVEAGMGFDAALARIAEQSDGRKSPLHQELMRTQLEIRAGRPRAEALRDLGERTGVSDLQTVVGAFIQTDKLGTPLGRTLRVHADAARVQRRHRAEELAHLAPLKMIFPTVFFLFPSFFLVAMAPSILAVVKLLNSLAGR